jgi:hypothetical protein
MCFAAVLALLLLPLGGWLVGGAHGGTTGGWIGAAIGLALALLLAGAPAAAFLRIEKKKYDRENSSPDA